MMKKGGLLLAVPVLAALFTGCVSSQKLTPTQAFVSGKYNDAYAEFKKEAQASDIKDTDYVLKNDYLVSAALACGDYDTVEDSALKSMKVSKSNLGKGKGKASLVAREAIKIFKGEPYEQATVAFYAGVAAYYKKNYENAIIYLKNALLFDKSSKEGYRDDFTAAQYLLAKSYKKLGMTDECNILANKIAETNPDVAALLQKKNNLTLIVELGSIGHKKPDRHLAAYDVFNPVPNIEDHCKIFVDGKEIGKSIDLVDLNHQAKTRGVSGVKAASQTAKGALKFAAGMIPIVGGLAKKAIHESMAALDLRQWFLLPQKLAVVEGNLKPGRHTLLVKFYDSRSNELRRFEQVFYYIPVFKGKETLLYCRASENIDNTFVASTPQDKKFIGKTSVPFMTYTYPADPEASFKKFMLSGKMNWRQRYRDKEEFFLKRD